MPSLAGLSWAGSGAQGLHSWGSSGVPREGTSAPSAAETGADLSHRVGSAAALPKGQSTEGGQSWSRSGRTGLPRPSAELHPPLLTPAGWASPDTALLATGHTRAAGLALSHHPRLSPRREWGHRHPRSPPGTGQAMPGSAPLCSGSAAIAAGSTAVQMLS